MSYVKRHELVHRGGYALYMLTIIVIIISIIIVIISIICGPARRNRVS